MLPNIGIIAYPKILSICREVIHDYQEMANFELITAALEDSIPIIKKKEREGLDILITGPGNHNLLKRKIEIPIIPFYSTTQALIKAIRTAQEVATEIALILSVEEIYDLPFLESLLGVRLKPFYCRTIKDYRTKCREAKKRGYTVIIGGSYTCELAESMEIKAIFSYDQQDIFREAIQKALVLFEYNLYLMTKKTQLNILLQNTNDPLFIVGKDKKIEWMNSAAEEKFSVVSSEAQGKLFRSIFKKVPKDCLNATSPKEILILYDNRNTVFNFHPIQIKDRLEGTVVMGLLADEIEEKDKKIRQYVHKKGFNAKVKFDHFIGSSNALQACIGQAKKYAGYNSPVLIYGETGTGKEMFAQAIHNHGPRKTYPFVAINCATLPGELLESELFGYEKGSFTGARKEGKKGLIEIAHRGTLFLDEISSLAYSLQAKLLRLIQEKEYMRIGGDEVIPIDIRIISASNLNLKDAIKEGAFRSDLYYRLNTLYLEIPPLRQRGSDVLELFSHYMVLNNPDLEGLAQWQKDTILTELNKLYFDGNIRELQNIAERFAVMNEPDQLKKPKTLVKCLHDCTIDADIKSAHPSTPESGSISFVLKEDLKSTLKQAEKSIIATLLAKTSSNRNEIADRLGIKRETLWRKLREHGLK